MGLRKADIYLDFLGAWTAPILLFKFGENEVRSRSGFTGVHLQLGAALADVGL